MSEKLAGRVERVKWGNDVKTIGLLRDRDGKTTTFILKGVARPGDGIEMTGEWATDPRFGRQFVADTWCLDAKALGVSGLGDYLAKHPGFEGIGAARARKLAEKFGDHFDDALQNEREEMAAVAGCPLEVIEGLAISWNREATINKTATRLVELGVTTTRARRLAAKYGGGVVEMIQENPWWLLGRLRGMGFATVDMIAGRLGHAKDHPERVMHAVIAALEREESEGHTWTPEADLVRAAEKLLNLDSLDSESIVRAGISRAIEADEVAEVSKGRRKGYGIKLTLECERFVVDELIRRGGSGGFFPSASPEFAVDVDPRLNERQAEAVASACRNLLSVMTGSAGTGKTFCINTVCRIAEQHGLRIALAAPTGKAAQRMEESTARAAKTIHRLLEPEVGQDDLGEPTFGFRLRGLPFLKEREGRTVEHPGFIEADLLVVDEVSMVDVRLAAALLRAVGPRTSLLLVGDPNQLPPVGPGSILRDLVIHKPCPVTSLEQVVRQAGVLKERVTAVLAGRVLPTTPAEPNPDGTVRPWVVSGRHVNPADAAAFVVKAFSDMLPKQKIVDPITKELRPIRPLDDIQILTPKHAGPIGTAALNRAIQRVVQRWRGVELPEDGQAADDKAARQPKPMAGDRVIWTRNDYELDLMNGTIGSVIEVDRQSGSFLVAFDGFEVPSVIDSRKASEKMQCAYAISVHKSQGSEFPVVISVIHKNDGWMHHRGLIYTAVSRARCSSIMVGDDYGVRACATKIKADTRRSIPSLVGSMAVSDRPS